MNSDEPTDMLLQIDSYIQGLFAPPDRVLENALRRSREAGLPEIHISASEGRLLQLLAEIADAERILEIGTLGGYSTIHLARTLPEDGSLVSLELDKRCAQIARENIRETGLENRIEVRVGDAKALLAQMVEDEEERFDLTFIDADKESYSEYLNFALELSRVGSLILADNTIRGGSVLDPKDESTRATRDFNERLAREPRLSALILPLIRERIDGLAIARVIES